MNEENSNSVHVHVYCDGTVKSEAVSKGKVSDELAAKWGFSEELSGLSNGLRDMKGSIKALAEAATADAKQFKNELATIREQLDKQGESIVDNRDDIEDSIEEMIDEKMEEMVPDHSIELELWKKKVTKLETRIKKLEKELAGAL